MDPTVQVAALGIIATSITVVGLIAVAIINNKRERGGSADAAIRETYEQRMKLRDERISVLLDQIAALEKENANLKAMVRRLMEGEE